jgi:enamine deaminase RidA (YjgF/YER057c/UK114 family)
MAVAEVKCIAPTRIGGTDIEYAQGVRAGPWLFFTGHMAIDFERGLAAQVAGKPGHPLGSPPRYRREGDFIIERLAKLTAAEGSDLRHIVRVDQYYPNAQVVNAYQRARKAALKDFVPPSTSVLMEELSVDGANMEVSMIAVLPGGGRSRNQRSRKACRFPSTPASSLRSSAATMCLSPAKCRTTTT